MIFAEIRNYHGYAIIFSNSNNAAFDEEKNTSETPFLYNGKKIYNRELLLKLALSGKIFIYFINKIVKKIY